MKRKTWEELMITRITLELPGEGKVTATMGTWNTLSIAFAEAADSNRLAGYYGIAKDFREKSHFIHEELAKRALYKTPWE